MMKKTLILCLCAASMGITQAQENSEPPPGSLSAKIYSHFNYGLDQENPVTAFEVTRAYFGYKRKLDNHFTAEVKLDIGSVDDQSEFSLIRRYAYFRNAYLSYTNGNVKTWFGLFDMLQFKLQENFWGYRYLYKSFMDEYRFGISADLGAGIQYSPSDLIKADLVLSNGEGYKNLQYDSRYRVGLGFTLNPAPGLTLRTYYTVYTTETPPMIFSGFAGYRYKKIRIAGEYNHQLNYLFNEGHSRFGYSFYSTYMFSDKWEVFGRYDKLLSNILPEGEVPWNLANDGSALLAGVQYTPIKYVHLSLNYQDWVEYAQNGNINSFIYLNIEIIF